MRHFIILFLCLALVVFLTACATTPRETQAVSSATLPYVKSDGNIRHDTANQRVAELWKSSVDEESAGRFENAINFLNQGLEIAPQDPVLWSRGAELYVKLKAFPSAENYAMKSNALAHPDSRTLQYRNWMIVKHSREMRGDLLGARKAEEMVTQLQP